MTKPGLDTSANSSFSREVPGLQLAIDSTSLGAFKTCPQFYYLSIVQGWQPREQSVHLTFGLLMHGARERYDHAKARALPHEQALAAALAWALEQTWNHALARPWVSDHKTKNRLTLARSIVWYLDECENEVLATVQLASGHPAVELSFRFDSGYRTASGEAWLYCGHLDRLATFAGQTWIVDLKTTERPIDGAWFRKFTPFNQFSMYALAGQVAFGAPVEGLIVDGLQVAAGFTKMSRGQVPRPKAILEEWHYDNGKWLEQMEGCAQVTGQMPDDPAGAWPHNDKSCDMYGGCQFREVCSRSPAARGPWLQANFTRRVWDPLQVRGDI